jgi:hypothetical protein
MVKNKFNTYSIWRKPFVFQALNARIEENLEWVQTSYSLKARTDEEARNKMTKMFKNCDFQSMSLVVALIDKNPNKID